MSEQTDIHAEREIASLKETLKQVAYQNEMMLRWVNGAVVTVDREGIVISANEVALKTLGWTEDEFIGKQMHETIHHSQDDGSEYPWDFCPVFAAIEDGSSHHVDGDVFWKKDGSSFSADYIVCPTRDEVSEITGAVLTFRNITEQKLNEGKRVHSMKLIAIGELSAGIAHEINTPVQFIGSNISFLQDSFEDLLKLIGKYEQLKGAVREVDGLGALVQEIEELEAEVDVEYLAEEGPKALDQTQHGVERVSELVKGLKGFAHTGQNETKIGCDINEIIKNSLIVCTNAFKYVAHLETDLAELPTVNAFPGDIGQVIVNLIVNAAHAISENRGQDNEMGNITVKSLVEDDRIVIRISDTGGGIPDNIKDRIFDPFFTTKEVGQGSGQGLAISHTIITEKHDGEISFTSKPGVGTTFTLKIPLQQKAN